jgi:ABC-2 type transport system permease protein
MAGKEWIQVRRDSRSLILSLLAPVFLVLLFGYALNMDVKNVAIAVLDMDRSSTSRQFIEGFAHNEYLTIHSYAENYGDLDGLLDSGAAALALVIPTGFARRLNSGRDADIQLIVDGSDSMSATVSAGYVRAMVVQYNLDRQIRGLAGSGIISFRQPVDVRSRVGYNEQRESRNFIIPGLIVIILAIISALITSLTISREWERGTMESLITTPVRPLEVVAGKIIPYLVIGAFDVVVTFLAGYFIFGIHLRGSFLELLLLALLFLFGTSMLGIVISAVTRVQVVSIQAAMIITYLPSFILSGFIFPIQNMPMLIQGLTYLIPARYMIVIIRSIVLKGIPAMFLKAQIIFMALFALLVFIAAVSRLRSSIMGRG